MAGVPFLMPYLFKFPLLSSHNVSIISSSTLVPGDGIILEAGEEMAEIEKRLQSSSTLPGM